MSKYLLVLLDYREQAWLYAIKLLRWIGRSSAGGLECSRPISHVAWKQA